MLQADVFAVLFMNEIKNLTYVVKGKLAKLKKIAPSGGRRENFWGISCEKSRSYDKKSYFFQLRREARKFWGISCEKSRFYAKKSFFFPIFFLGGGGARRVRPPPWIRLCKVFLNINASKYLLKLPEALVFGE